MINKPCHYCDHPAEEHTGIGLDQIRAGEGYTKNNVVPCCDICNTVKSNIFTEDEMRELLGPAVREIRKRRKVCGTKVPCRVKTSAPGFVDLRDGGSTAQTE